MRIALLSLAASLIAVGMESHTGNSVCIEPDALDRPALISPRANSAVLLAITRGKTRMLSVGEQGIVLLSNDDGISWQQSQVPVSVSLTNVHFVTPEKAWAVGHAGIVLHTEDGGATWRKQLDGRQVARLLLHAAEQTAAMRNDTGARQQLRDAQRGLRERPDKPFFDIHFLDEQRGFIVGAHNLFFATRDGGATWLPWQQRIDNPGGKHLYRITGIGSTIYIAGEQGALYRSTDAGQSFSAIDTPYHGSYFGLIALDRDNVLVHGLRGNAYRSNDGGRRWHKSDTGTLAGLAAGLALADGSIVLATQAGEVLRSTDRGRSFQSLPVARAFPFSGVAQSAGGHLLLSGARGVARIALPEAER